MCPVCNRVGRNTVFYDHCSIGSIHPTTTLSSIHHSQMKVLGLIDLGVEHRTLWSGFHIRTLLVVGSSSAVMYETRGM